MTAQGRAQRPPWVGARLKRKDKSPNGAALIIGIGKGARSPRALPWAVIGPALQA